ncbi:MAG: HD domain-containing protein [Caldilineae bacterium]|nr:MAG: HD domain-containing protein [Caldilineae bacterium]
MNAQENLASVPRFVHLVADPAYREAAAAAEEVLATLLEKRPRARLAHDLLCRDPEVNALWQMANYNTVAKLGFNDHGPIHAHLAATAAAQILYLLIAAGHVPDVIRAGAGNVDDAFLVVVMAGLLHDIGNALHRDKQEDYGLLLARDIVQRTLSQIYDDPQKAALVQTFILAAVASHGTDPQPITLEAGVVAVADATDMSSGRGRVAFARGKVDIHAVSAIAIRRVRVLPGTGTRPVAIEIEMTSEAGLFQVEKTLVRKLRRTPLHHLVAVRACMEEGRDNGRRIIDCVALAEGDLRPQAAAAP